LIIFIRTTVQIDVYIFFFCFVDTGEIPDGEVQHVRQYIEKHPSDRFLLSSFPANLKRKLNKDQYLSILKQLQDEGRGTIEESNNSTGPKAIVFIKKKKTQQQTNEPSSTNNFSS
jgi:hypothetical protein